MVPLFCASLVVPQERSLLRIARSKVSFTSDAPLESIKASTFASTGLLDPEEHTFVVQVPMRSLEGFNSPLQKEHFNENYLRSDLFPNAQFKGRIIEDISLVKSGDHRVRAKGELLIHGVSKERIIECAVKVDASGVHVRSSFMVAMADHGIRIPRVVHQKIAPEVKVEVDLHFASTVPSE